MADYFPLLSRTIASLGESTPEQRAFVYRRAREVLGTQLGKADPPVAPEAIEAELVAFDDSVARVEREAKRFDPPAPVEPAPAPRAPQPAAAPPAPPVAVAPQAPPVAAPSPPAKASVAPPVQVSPGQTPSRAAPPVTPPAASSKPVERAAAPVKSSVEPPVPAPVAPARRDPVMQVVSVPPRERAERQSSEEAPAEPSADASTDDDSGIARPRISERRERDMSWLRPIILGFAIAAVVIGVGVLAFALRDTPADFERQTPVATQEGERKISERLPSEPAPGEAPAAGSAPAGTAPGGGLQVTQRAALFEEPVEGSPETRTTQGRVVWRLDTGESDVAIRATIELGGALTGADILVRRNRDTRFPASHLVEFRFRTPENAHGPVRDIGVPEMRTEESVRGNPLAGLPVPVTDNVFLMGLTNLPAEIERNRDLLRTRNWILLPVRFADGRRALLLVEKGPTGDRVVADALQAWR